MKSVTGWSSGSEAVIRTLNRHPSFEINFKVTGAPDQPVFKGVEESLVSILKGDFGSSTLRVVRHRTTEELKKLEILLAS